MGDNIRYKIVDLNCRSILVSKNSCYSLTYLKNTIVTAAEHTLGIMVFKNLRLAEEFDRGFVFGRGQILKVIGIGYPTVPVIISKFLTLDDITKFYLNTKRYNEAVKMRSFDIIEKYPEFNFQIPEGTECYRSVKVLE